MRQSFFKCASQTNVDTASGWQRVVLSHLTRLRATNARHQPRHPEVTGLELIAIRMVSMIAQW